MLVQRKHCLVSIAHIHTNEQVYIDDDKNKKRQNDPLKMCFGDIKDSYSNKENKDIDNNGNYGSYMFHEVFSLIYAKVYELTSGVQINLRKSMS